jgi:hypothetical protein
MFKLLDYFYLFILIILLLLFLLSPLLVLTSMIDYPLPRWISDFSSAYPDVYNYFFLVIVITLLCACGLLFLKLIRKLIFLSGINNRDLVLIVIALFGFSIIMDIDRRWRLTVPGSIQVQCAAGKENHFILPSYENYLSPYQRLANDCQARVILRHGFCLWTGPFQLYCHILSGMYDTYDIINTMNAMNDFVEI